MSCNLHCRRPSPVRRRTCPYWYNEQLIRLGAGLEPDPSMKFLPAFISIQNRDKRMAQALDDRA